MKTITPKQQKVINAAKKQLEKHSWFKSVCCDKLQSDDNLDTMMFDEAVKLLVDDTIYFDGPYIPQVKSNTMSASA